MTVLPNPDYFTHPKFTAAAERINEQTRVAALNQFLPALQRAFVDLAESGRPDFDVRITAGSASLAELQETGITVLQVDPPTKALICEWADPLFGAIQQRLASIGRPKFKDMNVALDRGAHGALYAAVHDALTQLNVFDIGRAYVRRPLRIKKLFVQLNNDQETAARYGALGADGLPKLKTDYWHIDSDVWPNIKVLLYLNDVDLDSGPMRYVVDSHREVPDFETLVRKTNDSLRLPTEQFLALPDELRMHALFGPYLAGDESKSVEMLRRERIVCGGGDLILFDNNGVHRGGFVRKGERRLLQCLFEAV